ncbi:hypothetical protein [uncultured Treponema sp.]|uniref:hypothetical protein n=1 Tax=uncultured Treponema sp. TaxID=162155 RepID=UPI0025E58337|nr:hypothetical protein [uncultured Treponema sp.]
MSLKTLGVTCLSAGRAFRPSLTLIAYGYFGATIPNAGSDGEAVKTHEVSF